MDTREISRKTKVQLFRAIVRAVLIDVLLRSLETHENRSKEAGRFPIQVHETRIEKKVTADHLTPTIQKITGVNRASDEIRRQRWN